MTTATSGNQAFIAQRQELIDNTDDPALKKHFQDEIDLVKSWGESDITDSYPGADCCNDAPPATGEGPPTQTRTSVPADSTAPGLSITPPKTTGLSSLPPGQGGSPDSKNSNDKLAYLQPMFNKAAKDAGVPPDVVAALVLGEGPGYSVNEMAKLGGLAQCGEAEFNEERQRHPEFFPPGMKWDSPEGQIEAAAFRLKDNFGADGTWDGAAARYNGGENAGGGLNDSNYITKFHTFLNGIRNGSALPS